MDHRRATREGGFTIAELSFGLVIFVISAAVLINHITLNYQTTLAERDRVFAYGKAQAILAEIGNGSEVDAGRVDMDAVGAHTAASNIDSLGASLLVSIGDIVKARLNDLEHEREALVDMISGR